MEEFVAWVKSLVPENFDLQTFAVTGLTLIVAFLVLGCIGRLFFGKRSVLNQSVSSAIGILFIYVLTVVIHSYGVNLNFLVAPLPFVTISGDYMSVFSFAAADYVQICGQLLNMIILAFLVNLVNGWMPKGKKLLGWLFFRCLSVVLAMLLHVIVNAILNAVLPEGLLIWAPVILLGILVISLLTGALKLVVGAALSTINPLIAVLYTFFFASFIGKQISKAMLTTAIISAMVYALNYFGILSVFIGAAALAAYLPLIIILLALWYIVGHLL